MIVPIDTERIRQGLCWHDQRYPNYEDPLHEEGAIQPPRENCACDNCFYGRDRLARALLKALSGLQEAYHVADVLSLPVFADRMQKFINRIEEITK